jgi:hypothetical protein
VPLKSNFKKDLKKEQNLAHLLDAYYKKNLKHYNFERIYDLKRQLQGIDLIFTDRKSQNQFYIDEKAQLDYINDDLPTFAFELNYQKQGVTKQGWLFDPLKKTQFYALVTAIYADEPDKFTSCKITMVNRTKLISFLSSLNITENSLEMYLIGQKNSEGKMVMEELDQRAEGYLFFSRYNKAEKPVNLILKLDFLIENGIARRLV